MKDIAKDGLNVLDDYAKPSVKIKIRKYKEYTYASEPEKTPKEFKHISVKFLKGGETCI